MYFKLKILRQYIKFEWDNKKELENYKKQSIRFKSAVKVFYDEDAICKVDYSSNEETRYDLIGKFGSTLFVVYTLRSKNLVRIISARLATKAERSIYECYNSKNEGY